MSFSSCPPLLLRRPVLRESFVTAARFAPDAAALRCSRTTVAAKATDHATASAAQPEPSAPALCGYARQVIAQARTATALVSPGTSESLVRSAARSAAKSAAIAAADSA